MWQSRPIGNVILKTLTLGKFCSVCRVLMHSIMAFGMSNLSLVAYARPFELAPGRRVRLKGLIKMARLNGTTGCVVGYQPGEENKSDVVVACDADMGRRLALSVENVEMADVQVNTVAAQPMSGALAMTEPPVAFGADVQVTTVAAQPMSGALAMTEPPVAFGAAGVVAGALAATYAISVGDRVQIHGLIKCARLNGTQGTVTGMQQNDLLVALDEDNGRVLALDIKCVTRASSPGQVLVGGELRGDAVDSSWPMRNATAPPPPAWDMAGWLATIGLEDQPAVASALLALGVHSVADLQFVEEADLLATGVTLVAARKIAAAAALGASKG